MIAHPDPAVRFWSAHGLADIGGLAARPGLARAAASEDGSLRLMAAQMLPIEHASVRALTADPDDGVARAARMRFAG